MDVLALSRRIPLLGFFGSSAVDDDFADRLNYKYTVAILVVFAFIVTNKHFGHNQINCWVPALFSKNFEEYTNLVCWITNTYYIPIDKEIPSSEAERRPTELRYYQWVAYILLILALLFYLPRVLWRTLSTRSGIDIKDVVEASHDFKSVSKLEKNRKMMEYMIGTIDQYVDDPRRQRLNRNMNFIRRSIALMCFMFGKFLGNYLVVLYLFIKILYILNCIGQLFLISILLGRNYYIYGASIFRDMIQGKGYADSEYFPRVTMCKFQVRELGLKNFSHEYNVQCVLPINLFNQQIFTFLWFWYLILLLLNLCSLSVWVYRFIPRNQYSYAIRRIKLLRIRLNEDAKIPKSNERNKFKSTTYISNEKEYQAKKIAIQKILTDRENQHLYNDEEKDEKAILYRKFYTDTNTKAFFDESMFPNLPVNFEFDSTYHKANLANSYGMNTNTSLGSNDDLSLSFNFEYEKYMTNSSFTVKNYKEFVYEYLEPDGMFMLRMVASNSGDFVCTQVLHNLWKLFLCKKQLLNNDNQNLFKSMSSLNTKKSESSSGMQNSRIEIEEEDDSRFVNNNNSSGSERNIRKRTKIKSSKKQSPAFSFFHDKLVKKISSSNNKKRFNFINTNKKFAGKVTNSKATTSLRVSADQSGRMKPASQRDTNFEDESKRFQSIRRVVKKTVPSRSSEI